MFSFIPIEKLSPTKTTTYQVISQRVDDTKHKINKNIIATSSNIIEESFVNATTNDMFTTFGEELVTEVTDTNDNNAILNQGNIEVITTTATNNAVLNKKPDEFDIFGNFIAEVMRNMAKSQSRLLQMNIMKLIADSESEN